MDEPSRQAEIREVIEAKDFAKLKALLSGMEVHDLAELVGQLTEEHLALCFRMLPTEAAAQVLAALPIEKSEELVQTLSTEKVAGILNDMSPDDRTALLEELPGRLAQRLLNGLRGDELKIARSLLAYPEDSIGRLMTPEYVVVRADWTVEQVLAHIRKVGTEKETLNVLYVVDAEWRLIDEVRLEQIILAGPERLVGDLMDHQAAALEASEDREHAIEIFQKYDAVALPVVNREGVLVGIVTVDDVLDVVEEEYTEDVHKMAGMGVLEHSYFGTGFLEMLGKRLPWLALLLCAQMLTTLALANFHALELFAVLVVFVPLINSPAGNTGSQVAGLMIRGLAVQEVGAGDWGRVLRREVLRGLVLGTTLGVIGYGAAYLFAPMAAGGHTAAVAANLAGIALSVAVAIAVAVTVANVLGSMLPFFFKRMGLDPAVTSGPFIASLMDVSGILLYFTIALAVLHLARP